MPVTLEILHTMGLLHIDELQQESAAVPGTYDIVSAAIEHAASQGQEIDLVDLLDNGIPEGTPAPISVMWSTLDGPQTVDFLGTSTEDLQTLSALYSGRCEYVDGFWEVF